MQSLRSLAVALGLTGSLFAQTNTYILYPDDARAATTQSTRYSFGPLAGEVLQEVPGGSIASLGDGGSNCTVTNMSILLQDENNATQEAFSVILRSAALGGGPDATPSGIIASSSPIQSPLGAGGVGSSLITVTFASPVTVLCTGSYFYGVSLSANANYPASDGLSVHNAINPPTGTLGSNARSTAPTIAWQIYDPGFGLTALPAASPRVANIGLGTAQAVLNIGNRDPLSTRSPSGIDYGLGGLFPAVKSGGRDDGLEAKITDTPNNNGIGVVFLGIGSFGPALNVPGFTGRIRLNLSFPVIELAAAFITGATVGTGKVQIVPPGSIPAATGVNIYFQAITVNAGYANPRISNAVAVSF